MDATFSCWLRKFKSLFDPSVDGNFQQVVIKFQIDWFDDLNLCSTLIVPHSVHTFEKPVLYLSMLPAEFFAPFDIFPFSFRFAPLYQLAGAAHRSSLSGLGWLSVPVNMAASSCHAQPPGLLKVPRRTHSHFIYSNAWMRESATNLCYLALPANWRLFWRCTKNTRPAFLILHFFKFS